MREMEILKGLEGGENMAVQFVDHLLPWGSGKRPAISIWSRERSR